MLAGNRGDRTSASVFSRGDRSPRAASRRDGSAFGELSQRTTGQQAAAVMLFGELMRRLDRE